MKKYRKKELQPMMPWTPGTSMQGISISQADNGSPKEGDMLAKEFFEEHYEEVL